MLHTVGTRILSAFQRYALQFSHIIIIATARKNSSVLFFAHLLDTYLKDLGKIIRKIQAPDSHTRFASLIRAPDSRAKLSHQLLWHMWKQWVILDVGLGVGGH